MVDTAGMGSVIAVAVAAAPEIEDEVEAEVEAEVAGWSRSSSEPARQRARQRPWWRAALGLFGVDVDVDGVDGWRYPCLVGRWWSWHWELWVV